MAEGGPGLLENSQGVRTRNSKGVCAKPQYHLPSGGKGSEEGQMSQGHSQGPSSHSKAKAKGSSKRGPSE